ncbi:MAG: hypothetical protein UW79_C0015G0015 [Candidatus Yanofskybacteria bacterium GW2011_GWA2_44_9]|uniref:Uncharacterized protein n=1 Tax=Candidatus Yanofskybacteria bacterium GW2011_GWA2_44_9 TaxID=1619025 RepID=A0A0G1KDG6_9BACT|nr:MAG: hypothetical protein UW79_C0015G0015 [Candidatus Yanofskybacteria bacterium GW2011_GWA2_44_9]OGN05051.1 MAG: hypothetical protein A2659_01320 [Candidatus Yanofskybacteria bacterium RIFCSPHIGHO2_01_FULL_44_24]
MNNQNDKKILSIEQAATILSETLEDVAKRKTSLKRARTISRLALELSKITEIADLKNRIEFLEQALKKRK